MAVLEHHPLVEHAPHRHRLDRDLGQPGGVQRFAPAGFGELPVVIAGNQRHAGLRGQSLERIESDGIVLADPAQDGRERGRRLVFDGDVEEDAKLGEALAGWTSGGHVEDVAEQDQLAVRLGGHVRAQLGQAAALVLVAEHRDERALPEVQVADHVESHGVSLSALSPTRARFPPFLPEEVGLLPRDLRRQRPVVPRHAPPGDVRKPVEHGDHGASGPRLSGAHRHLAVRQGGAAWDTADHAPHCARKGAHLRASHAPARTAANPSRLEAATYARAAATRPCSTSQRISYS